MEQEKTGSEEKEVCRYDTCQLVLLRKQLKEALQRIAKLEREKYELRRKLKIRQGEVH